MKGHVPRTHDELKVVTFYRFQSLSGDQLTRLESRLHEAAARHEVKGLSILGREGLNTTLCGRHQSLDLFVAEVAEAMGVPSFDNIKTTWVEPGEKEPFAKFVVKVRSEIVTLGRPDLQPLAPHTPTHLPPSEWHKHLSERPTKQVIDTRNTYETSIGTFADAICPEIEEFRDFPDWLDSRIQAGAIDPSQPTYIFCTGGIRCEKAIRLFEERGFKEAYQLDGGILNYIDQFPASKSPSLWKGECFVFDQRVAVDGDGHASHHYSTCPHCGQPAEHAIYCVRCDSPAVLCDDCFGAQTADAEPRVAGATCSKNCHHHWLRSPGVKGKPQRLGEMRPRRGP